MGSVASYENDHSTQLSSISDAYTRQYERRHSPTVLLSRPHTLQAALLHRCPPHHSYNITNEDAPVTCGAPSPSQFKLQPAGSPLRQVSLCSSGPSTTSGSSACKRYAEKVL